LARGFIACLLLDSPTALGQVKDMDADEREVYQFLKTFGEEYVNVREICRRATTKRRYYEDNNWAKPALQRMKERQIVESDIQGRYRIKPLPRKGRKGRWVSPDIKKILQESGVQVEGEPIEADTDEHYEQL
jgi:hypothetical protein